MEKIYKTKRGFTLVEIMLVVAILVILASVGFINWVDGLQKSQNVQDRDTSKFVTKVQSQNNYIRQSMLPARSGYSAHF